MNSGRRRGSGGGGQRQGRKRRNNRNNSRSNNRRPNQRNSRGPRKPRRASRPPKKRELTTIERIKKWFGGKPQKKTQRKSRRQEIAEIELVVDSTKSMEVMPLLFALKPELAGNLSWTGLRGAEAPSKPVPLTRSQHLWGENYVFMKREALDAGLMAENPARKLEFLLEPQDQKSLEIVGSDFLGGSFGLALAQCCRLLGLKLELLLLESKQHQGFDKHLKELKDLNIKPKLFKTREQLERSINWRKSLGKIFPKRVLPFSGVTAGSVIAYVSAMLELDDEMKSRRLPPLDYIFVPVGTGMTLAGLEIGRRLSRRDSTKIIGIQCLDPRQIDLGQISEKANEAIDLLNGHLKEKLDFKLKASDFNLIRAKSNQNEQGRFWSRLQEIEGIELENVYSGPSLSALNEFIEQKKLSDQRILFWNTYSGGGASYTSGPDPFLEYEQKRNRKIGRSRA